MGDNRSVADRLVRSRRGGRLVATFAIVFLLLLLSVQLPLCGYSPNDRPPPSDSPEREEETDADPPAAPSLVSAVLSSAVDEDVAISWSLSADDGAGDSDVSHYEIYYSTVYDYDGDGYSNLGQVDSGENQFTHTLAGDGDWSNYFYYVQANDTSGNINWSGQAGKFVRHFEEGKQIASIFPSFRMTPLLRSSFRRWTEATSMSGTTNHPINPIIGSPIGRSSHTARFST